MIRQNVVTVCLALWASFPALTESQAMNRVHPVPSHRENYTIETQLLENVTAETRLGFEHTVRAPGAAWMRLRFGDWNLGDASYIVLTSFKDEAWQVLDAKSLTQWSGRSAFFNGSEVGLQLYLAPGDKQVFLRLEELTIGASTPMSENLHGDRVGDDCPGLQEDLRLSQDPGAGRILVTWPPGLAVGGTAWIAANAAHVTAKHVANPGIEVLQFNVPLSNADGTTNHPHPNDQYAVDQDSLIVSECSGETCRYGHDWAVFSCHPNPNTGLLPVQSQAAHGVQPFFRVTRDQPAYDPITGSGTPWTVRTTGYGKATINEPLSHRFAQRISSGDYFGETVYGPDRVHVRTLAKITQGFSGGVMSIDGSRVAVGIAEGYRDLPGTECGVPSGTGFKNGLLQLALSGFPSRDGETIWYVDNGHPYVTAPLHGTITRPYASLADAVAMGQDGDRVLLVAGSYQESITINHPLSLEAPVGPVTIIGE